MVLGWLICLFCSSPNLIRNWKTLASSQRFLCHACGKSFVIDGTRTTYTAKMKKLVQHDLSRGLGIREIARKYGISTNTVYYRR